MLVKSSHAHSHHPPRYYFCQACARCHVAFEGEPLTHLTGYIACRSPALDTRIWVCLFPKPRSSATSGAESCCQQRVRRLELSHNCTGTEPRTQHHLSLTVQLSYGLRWMILSLKASHLARHQMRRILDVYLPPYHHVSATIPLLGVATYIGATGGSGEPTYPAGAV